MFSKMFTYQSEYWSKSDNIFLKNQLTETSMKGQENWKFTTVKEVKSQTQTAYHTKEWHALVITRKDS